MLISSLVVKLQATEIYPGAVEGLPDILEEYVIESGWEFLPYKHFRYFRFEGQCGVVQVICVCVHCKFWFKIFDVNIMNLHLYRRGAQFPSSDRIEYRRIVFTRLEMQLYGIYNVTLRDCSSSSLELN